MRKVIVRSSLMNFLEDQHNPEAERFRQLCVFDKLGVPDRRTMERRFKNIFHFFRIIIQKMGLVIVRLKIINKQGRVVDSTRESLRQCLAQETETNTQVRQHWQGS